MDGTTMSRYPVAVEDGAVLSVAQVLKVLRKHAPLIVLVTIVFAVGGFLYARSVPKTYTASMSIALDGDRFAIPELQGALRGQNSPDPMPMVKTELQAIAARGLVQSVVDSLELVKDPEFNAALRPPTVFGGFMDQVSALISPRGQSDLVTPARLNEAVLTEASKSLSTFQDNRSLVISLGFTSENPKLSATFLNTLVADYLASKADRQSGANRAADDVLDKRIAQMTTELDDLGKKLNDLRSSGEFIALRAGSVGQQQVEDLVSAAARASVERAQIEASTTRAGALVRAGSTDALAGVLDSPTISRLRQQESESASKVADLSSRYGPNFPELRGATADLSAVRRQLAVETGRVVASLGTQLKVARDKEADLQGQLAVARKNSVVAENAKAKLDQLQQEIDTRRALYGTLIQRKQQTQVGPAVSQTPDIRILSSAVPPSEASGPNTKLITGVSGITGGVLGCLLALLRLHTINGFDDAADVTRRLGIPVIATIERRSFRPGLLARVARGGSPDALAVGSMRERISFTSARGVPRSVLFTAALAGVDSAALAAAFAEANVALGDTVLLVEANLARPALQRLYGSVGGDLASVLRGGQEWQAKAGGQRGCLHHLLVNKRLVDGVELLSGIRFQNLLIEARQRYDFTIMSGADAMTSEVAALAARVDLTVLLIDAKAGYPRAQEALERLRSSPGAAFAGVLVT